MIIVCELSGESGSTLALFRQLENSPVILAWSVWKIYFLKSRSLWYYKMFQIKITTWAFLIRSSIIVYWYLRKKNVLFRYFTINKTTANITTFSTTLITLILLLITTICIWNALYEVGQNVIMKTIVWLSLTGTGITLNN